MLEPLFEQKEALGVLAWLDKVNTEPVSAGTIEKLKKLVGLWTE